MRKEIRIKTAAAAFAVMLFCMIFLSACSSGRMAEAFPGDHDLVIYTVQEKTVYEPVVKEFEERTGLKVKVERGTREEMLRVLEEQKDPEWDLVFGVGTETLEEAGEYWQPCDSPEASCIIEDFRCRDGRWAAFSARPLVIMYNTNVVTYRELPSGWNSLLEPRWKGRVAFMDPVRSDTYAAALVTAFYACGEDETWLSRLMENLEYCTLESPSEVNEGIADGIFSLGVTTEEWAQALRQRDADIDYVYPAEGTTALTDGTAILAGCAHPDNAESFLEFTLSLDTQRILVSELNRRSVRADVMPLPGQPGISRLPLLELKEQSGDKERIMAQWKDILSQREGGKGK